MELHLSEWMAVQDVDTSTEFLTLVDEKTKDDGTTVYEYCQKENYSEWAKISNTFLGEILLIGKDSCTSVCVILQSKQDETLTIINPGYVEIKAQAFQTLEVVFWDAEAYPHLTAKIHAGMGALMYKQLGHEIIAPEPSISEIAAGITNGFLIRPRNKEYKEHHFWFELDVRGLSYLTTLGRGSYWGGRIEFSDGATTFVVNTTLNVRKRSRMRGAKGAQGKLKGKPRTAIAKPNVTRTQVTYPPRKKSYYGGALQKEVTLTALDDSLEEGCKVLCFDEVETFMAVEAEREKRDKWRSNAWIEYD